MVKVKYGYTKKKHEKYGDMFFVRFKDTSEVIMTTKCGIVFKLPRKKFDAIFKKQKKDTHYSVQFTHDEFVTCLKALERANHEQNRDRQTAFGRWFDDWAGWITAGLLFTILLCALTYHILKWLI